jgi:hypothetical protein
MTGLACATRTLAERIAARIAVRNYIAKYDLEVEDRTKANGFVRTERKEKAAKEERRVVKAKY